MKIKIIERLEGVKYMTFDIFQGGLATIRKALTSASEGNRSASADSRYGNSYVGRLSEPT